MPTRSLSCSLVAVLVLTLAGPASAADGGVQRSLARYEVPDVPVVTQDGATVRLPALIDRSRQVMVQFVFTSCTTICSLLGAVFANVQKRLGPEAKDARFVSVSIDPDNDTPAKLKGFLEKFHAEPNWTFVTGSAADVTKVQKAFDAWTENKMNHVPLTFLWSPKEQQWVRLNGFVTPQELADEYRQAKAAK